MADTEQPIKRITSKAELDFLEVFDAEDGEVVPFKDAREPFPFSLEFGEEAIIVNGNREIPQSLYHLLPENWLGDNGSENETLL